MNKTVVKGLVGNTKTEASMKLVPLHPYQIEDLNAWRAVAPYPDDDDWVFACHRANGRKPYWPDMILARRIRPLAKNLGINKRTGWHTFRRTFSSMRIENKEDVKVAQELMRHANPNTTLRLYAQARPDHLRSAQRRVVEMVRQTPLPGSQEEQKALLCVNVHEEER